jgi:hypothetical protein
MGQIRHFRTKDMPILLAMAMAAPVSAGFDLSGQTVIARFRGEGAQIYACVKRAEGSPPVWTLREPVATLIEDGRTVGRHFAGPHWELDDGSLIAGQLLQSLPGAATGDIPELRLAVTGNRGTGRLAGATGIYRLNTHGGALSGPCDSVGMLQPVPYSADYVFTRQG